MSELAVLLERVSFAYDGIAVLEEADLCIPQREAVCIVGPNGGGKTTLLRLILGQIQPMQGSIRVFGQTPRRARLRVGYMPQHARHDLQFPITVMEVVLMGRLGQPGLRGLFGWYGQADRRAAVEALGQVEMDAFARRPFAALSGGQRQRVLIARALASQPELLLLDEPTANVDTLVEGRLTQILSELSRRMAIVIVSHDLGFVSRMVRQVVCVNRRVVIHPTSEITGEAIHSMYHDDVRMVRHGDVLPSREHAHG